MDYWTVPCQNTRGRCDRALYFIMFPCASYLLHTCFFMSQTLPFLHTYSLLSLFLATCFWPLFNVFELCFLFSVSCLYPVLFCCCSVFSLVFSCVCFLFIFFIKPHFATLSLNLGLDQVSAEAPASDSHIIQFIPCIITDSLQR